MLLGEWYTQVTGHEAHDRIPQGRPARDAHAQRDSAPRAELSTRWIDDLGARRAVVALAYETSCNGDDSSSSLASSSSRLPASATHWRLIGIAIKARSTPRPYAAGDDLRNDKNNNHECTTSYPSHEGRRALARRQSTGTITRVAEYARDVGHAERPLLHSPAVRDGYGEQNLWRGSHPHSRRARASRRDSVVPQATGRVVP